MGTWASSKRCAEHSAAFCDDDDASKTGFDNDGDVAVYRASDLIFANHGVIVVLGSYPASGRDGVIALEMGSSSSPDDLVALGL